MGIKTWMSEVAKAAERACAGSVELCLSSEWDAQRWPVAAADANLEVYGVGYANVTLCALFHAAYPGKVYGDFKKWWGKVLCCKVYGEV